MNYTSREVVRRLKQYDMFLNSLKLTKDDIQKERICDQLDKIEKQILLDTNSEYEEEYLMLLSKKTRYIEEEKTRLRNIITLINDRKDYLNKRKNDHKKITGSLVELTSFLGEDKLDTYEKRLSIIEKYEENKAKQEKIIREMKILDVKISEASRNVKANTRLNESLEKKMITLVGSSLEKQGLYRLMDKKEDILRKHAEFKYAVSLAKENLKTANELSDSEYILECNNILNDVNMLYTRYNEDVNIINLINIYDKKTANYDELLDKRNTIDNILKNITGTELYKNISSELFKQYNTIKLESNDIKNYEYLKEEREKRNKLLYEIDEENNSKEFKNVLEELIKNENRQKEEQIKKARHEEQVERQKKIAEEQKIEAARVRRQKLIEEAKLKEQLEVAEKMKKLQDETVIKKNNDKKINTSSEYDNILPKESDVKEDRVDIKNPLKNKTLDEVMSFSSDFDTDELFENTRITPNKPLENSLLKEAESSIAEDTEFPLWEETKVEEKKIDPPKIEKEIPIKKEISPKKEETLFKEEDTTKKMEVSDNKKDNTPSKKESSIYDLLENNSNIIWKTTDSSNNKKGIPVIENNKLKPEIISSDNMSFPDLNKKDGEVLWKETL